MRIFQYWDTGDPPREVAAWIDGFRTMNPGMRHRLFDQASASRFIAKRHGARFQRAFETCAVPSMQADYFRMCAVLARGGAYVDADLQCLAPLDDLFERAPAAMMFLWGSAMTHSVMMFRSPGDPLLRACLKLATENIEARRFGSAYLSTGPAVPNALRAALEPDWYSDVQRRWPGMRELVALARDSLTEPAKVAASIKSLTLVHFLAAERWIGTSAPAYKDTGVHWLNWTGPIYREAGTEPLAAGR